jgi:prepilin-type N-terminal cleavage/methylation domain-containing protein
MNRKNRNYIGNLREGAARIVRSRKAFSLPELLVTLVVSGLLVGGIVSGYMVQKKTYEDEADLIDMQMNGRLAMNRVAEVIRSAGLGCKDNFQETDKVEGAFTDYTEVFTVLDRNDGPDRLTVVTGLRSRTRVETVGADHVILEEIENPNGVPYFDVDKNRYIFFSPQADNQYLEALAVDDVAREVRLSHPCTTTGNDFCSIRQGDNVFRVNAYTITVDETTSGVVYDVDGDGSDIDYDGDGTPDLYIYSNANDLIPDPDIAGVGQVNVSTAEVAEGIDDIQFQYGWDDDDSGEIEPDEFVDNPPLDRLDEVRAVRVFILVRTLSDNPNYQDPNTAYTLANHTINLSADDRRYHRQVFEETVMVRNLNL